MDRWKQREEGKLAAALGGLLLVLAVGVWGLFFTLL